MMSEQNKRHPIKLFVGGVLGAVCGFVIAVGFVLLCLFLINIVGEPYPNNDTFIMVIYFAGSFSFLGILFGGYFGAFIGGGRNSLKAWLVASGICLVIVLVILFWLCTVLCIAVMGPIWQ
jgi:hypothetical protein